MFKTVLAFGKRYINNSYSITLYLNMGRMVNAENELNELYISSKDLLREINFLRLQIVCKVVWLMKKGIANLRFR